MLLYVTQLVYLLSYKPDGQGFKVQFLAGAKYFSFLQLLGPTDPPVKWVMEAIFLGYSG